MSSARVLNLLLAVALLIACDARPWDKPNDPAWFNREYQYAFDKLPLIGKIQGPLPWSDSYWPSYKGGIAFRWNSPRNESFNYTLHSKEAVAKMTKQELVELSPAEKYDIFVGRYDYPTVKAEWARTSPKAEEWEGICHGWAPAAINFEEPNATDLLSADNVTVPFGSGDVKALLSYWAGIYDPSGVTQFVGTRCYQNITLHPEYTNSTACDDINAGTLHIILANQLGLLGKGFVADVDRNVEVWNQPISGYSSKIKEEKVTAYGKAVLVETKFTYTVEDDAKMYKHEASSETDTYEYWLELNHDNWIIGGEHVAYDRSDFFWKEKSSPFAGYFSQVQRIYENSIKPSPVNSFIAYSRPMEFSAANSMMISNSVDGEISVKGGYKGGETKVWKIAPKDATRIRFQFFDVDTVKDVDCVRIFEGEDGPLLAIVSGQELHKTIDLMASEVSVVFTSGGRGNDNGGFSAIYYSK